MSPEMVEQTRTSDRHGTIFVTGGSGVVGRALLELLDGYPVLALRHSQDMEPHIATVRGDLATARLGLDEATYNRLLSEVRVIVHCAALTSVSPRTDHGPINKQGTEHVLSLARKASIPTVYVSTAFVEKAISPVREPSGYEASKREAEQLVREAGVPFAIVRPSLVAGDSRTGKISAFQGLHLVLSRLACNQLPIVPSHPGAFIDFVPQDYVAEVIKALIDTKPRQWPELVWATQGSGVLTTGEFLEGVQSFSAEVGLPRPTTRFIPHDRIARLFEPVFLPALPARQRREVRALLMFARYLNVKQPFPSLTHEGLATLDVPPVQLAAEVLRRNLEHWWRHYGSLQNGETSEIAR